MLYDYYHHDGEMMFLWGNTLGNRESKGIGFFEFSENERKNQK